MDYFNPKIDEKVEIINKDYGVFIQSLIAKNGKLVKGYQVGVSTKSGIPVIRERRTMKDIAEALGEAIIEFIKYK